VHLQPLCSGANVLFLHPPSVLSAERAALGAARDRLGKRGSPCAARSPFISVWEIGRGLGGEGDGRPACSAAQALKPLKPFSIA